MQDKFIPPGDAGFGEGCLYGCFSLLGGGLLAGTGGAYLGASKFGLLGGIIGGVSGLIIGTAGGFYAANKITGDEVGERHYNINLSPRGLGFDSFLINSINYYFKEKDRKILTIFGSSDAMQYGEIQHCNFFEPKHAFLRLNMLLPLRKKIILDICYGGNSGYINIDSYDSKLMPKKALEEIIKDTENKLFGRVYYSEGEEDE